MEQRFIKIPFLSVSSRTTTQYHRIFDFKTNDFYKGDREKNPTPIFKKHSSSLSSKAVRNLRRSVDTLLNIVSPNIILSGKDKQKISFITLTLPSPQIKDISFNTVNYYATDKEIKRDCLNQLLTEFRTKYDDFLYVFVSEKQLNGSIHFHLLVNKFIPYSDLLSSWNRLINKYGFVDRYTEKMQKLSFEDYFKISGTKDKKKALISYKRGLSCGWTSPNSVSIENLKKVENVSSYICKYMSKGSILSEEQKKYVVQLALKHDCLTEHFISSFYEIDGRIWQCSQDISKKRKCILHCNLNFEKEFTELLNNVKNEANVLLDEFFTVVCHDLKTLKKRCQSIFKYYMCHLRVDFSKYDVFKSSPTFSATSQLIKKDFYNVLTT